MKLAILFGLAALVSTQVLAADTPSSLTDLSNTPDLSNIEEATFGGGCFWCMQQAFDKIDGVVSTTVGYSGGELQNPTYKQVSGGGTGHTEVLRVAFDTNKITYADLLKYFWINVDPTVADRQFCDIGSQYRAVIFYHSDAQRSAAQASKEATTESKPFSEPIVTPIEPLKNFFVAEDYHQSYYKKNPLRYRYYKWSCGRDKRLEELWGEPKN